MDIISNEFEDQIKLGKRFGFGKNWKDFQKKLTPERIEIAKKTIPNFLGLTSLQGLSFLDIGSGSGLFSLAAVELGASVFSFDFDPDSVECTQILKNKFHDNSNWVIEKGSALDEKYVSNLGKFDIVYSWGVLHHTGNMRLALENAAIPVKENGLLFISIYNDQGIKSKIWLAIKKIYNSGTIGRLLILLYFIPYYFFRLLISSIVRLENPVTRYFEYKKKRGMSMIHDWKDWLGGLPFEVATPQYLFNFYKERGFILENLNTTNSLGCNEFVFRKTMEVKNQL